MTAPMRWAFAVQSVPFTQAVIDGQSSLGGSESACLGLARALVARGHDVHVFAADLQAPPQLDSAGVKWHPLDQLKGDYLHWTWDVFVGLRIVEFFQSPPHARYRILWNQDLLIHSGQYRGQPARVMSMLWGVDRLAYVSQYHRAQWEGAMPDASSLGWVTRNSFDPADLPNAPVEKDPYRIIHISRPERGLGPLLAMWPALRARVPQATLALCRYQSMYDGEGSAVRQSCLDYDAEVARVNAEVGGITWLGSLSKPDLYRAISGAAVMWYPGIDSFAETSCIAAIEAQACGTPLVASYTGALPETAPAAILIDGDAWTDGYQAQSIAAVVSCLGPQAQQTPAYLAMVAAGRAHVMDAYTHDAVAAYWERDTLAAMDARAAAHPAGIVRALMQEDDHVAAKVAILRVAEPSAYATELAFCQRVIDGEDQTAEQYAEHALADPIAEGDKEARLHAAAERLAGAAHVLDVACGNGAFALLFARQFPAARVTGLDYAEGNIAVARAAAERIGAAERTAFVAMPVYDFATHRPAADLDIVRESGIDYDAAFLGEILEHLEQAPALLDAVERLLTPCATVCFTVPHGPFTDLLPRGAVVHKGHVHHFEIDDILAMVGGKANLHVSTLHYGETLRGDSVGAWVVNYTTSGVPCGQRDVVTRTKRIRPFPRLSVGMIVKDAANDLRRCLESVWAIADEIVIGDTGSTDETVAIAESFGAKVRVLHLPSVFDHPDGFSGPRNDVLDACTGEWFLWIDADEVLEGARHLRELLYTGPFNGYVIRQHHLMFDADRSTDTPVRLFRRLPSIRFYGCVHEQPQMGDANTDITPALQLADVNIVHYGYRTEAIRRHRAARNFPLMLRSRQRFPDRELNWVIELRECVIRAADLVAQHGAMTTDAQRLYAQAVQIFESRYADPAHKFHALARPFYDMALEHHVGTWEYEYALAGRPGEIRGRAKPRRLRVRRPEDLEAAIAQEVRAAYQAMRATPPNTRPVAGAPATVDAGLHAEVLA